MNQIKWWQWILIIIVAGIVFYLCYPKYYFSEDGVYALNKITGNVKLGFQPGSLAFKFKKIELETELKQLKEELAEEELKRLERKYK